MAVRELRRIGAPGGAELSDRLQAQLLHCVAWRPEMALLEREHPDLIVRNGENVLGVAPGRHGLLVYGFENERVFADAFPKMLAKLLPRARRELGLQSVRFRLTHSPAKPVVEPILKRLEFEPSRDWIMLAMERTARLPAAPAPRGLRFREATPQDAEALAQLDAHAFPSSPLGVESLTGLMRDDAPPIVAQRGGRIVGFSLYSTPEPGEGYINIVAVEEAERGQGIGAALTIRALKKLFASGARRVSLTTDGDNGAALRLYVRLGFRQSVAGRDYTRLTSQRAIEQRRKQQQGTLIRFGGWR